MKRSARLQSARSWIPTYEGKDLVRGYARWYCVDRICAVIELTLIGVEIPAERLEHEHTAVTDKGRARKYRAAKRAAKRIDPPLDDDFHPDFLFIAGYTAGGAPYGIMHDE